MCSGPQTPPSPQQQRIFVTAGADGETHHEGGFEVHTRRVYPQEGEGQVTKEEADPAEISSLPAGNERSDGSGNDAARASPALDDNGGGPPPRVMSRSDSDDCGGDRAEDSDSNESDKEEEAEMCARLGCFRAKSHPLLAGWTSVPPRPPLPVKAPPSPPRPESRRRIHPRKARHPHKPHHVSFSELVSVKEISRYSCSDLPACFYTAEELRRFRTDYILGVNDPDDDIIEMMQDLVESAYDLIRSVPNGICHVLSSVA